MTRRPCRDLVRGRAVGVTGLRRRRTVVAVASSRRHQRRPGRALGEYRPQQEPLARAGWPVIQRDEPRGDARSRRSPRAWLPVARPVTVSSAQSHRTVEPGPHRAPGAQVSTDHPLSRVYVRPVCIRRWSAVAGRGPRAGAAERSRRAVSSRSGRRPAVPAARRGVAVGSDRAIQPGPAVPGWVARDQPDEAHSAGRVGLQGPGAHTADSRSPGRVAVAMGGRHGTEAAGPRLRRARLRCPASSRPDAESRRSGARCLVAPHQRVAATRSVAVQTPAVPHRDQDE